jgi:uncharacterized heparinase superfamily protein
MLLAYDRGAGSDPPPVSRSGYVRLEAGPAVLVMDAGAPPPLELAGQACAGCLSFEVSTGAELLLVNGGLPVAAYARAAAAARGTGSHNALVLGGQSSAKLVRSAGLRRRIGAAPILHPERVTCELGEVDGGIGVRASHDGYVRPFGLIHERTLILSADGACLDGQDVLSGAGGEMRLAHDVPAAVHFHLPPHARAGYGAAEGTAELTLRTGERWLFAASGATLTVEPGTHYADVLGPVQAQQIVLRTACYGATTVRWRLERVPGSDPAG